jgi:hypothetical protein
MAKASLHGLTTVLILGTFMTTTFMVQEFMSGPTNVCSQVSGATTKWRATEHSLGPTAEDMLESMSTT